MKNRLRIASRTEAGFSAIELLIVLVIIGIMSAISLPYLLNYKKLYKTEDQAIKVMDIMREASQLALTRRRTFRIELDLTDNAVLIIDEDGAAPDKQIKKIPLELTKDVRMDVIPATIAKPNPPNFNDIAFSIDAVGHLVGATPVISHSVWVARFKSDGSVVNNADTPISVNIYAFPPLTPGSTTARNKTEVRCITLFGGSGAIRFWKYNGTTFVGY